MRKRSAPTDHKGQEGPEPHTALRALARLLGRQAAREVVAQRWMTTGTGTTAAVCLPDPVPIAISTRT